MGGQQQQPNEEQLSARAAAHLRHAHEQLGCVLHSRIRARSVLRDALPQSLGIADMRRGRASLRLV